jgi:imidazolonepropionase-like amidohydrolase
LDADPGLTDAHVHCAIVETDPGKARRESPATMAFRIAEVLEQTSMPAT